MIRPVAPLFPEKVQSALEALIETDRSAAETELDRALRTVQDSGSAPQMLALHLLAVKFWQDDMQQSAFHRTHAYVYALEAGDWVAADELYASLAAEGRI